MAICRRHAAWSVATLTDGLVTNFIVPMGPLLLLSHLELVHPYLNKAEDVDPLQAQVLKDGMGNEVSMHWAVVARLWSQVCFGSRAMAPNGCRSYFCFWGGGNNSSSTVVVATKEMVVW